MSNALGNNGGRFYSSLVKPVLNDCNFVIDATNGNGLGIRSLKGDAVKAVYMNTTASITGTTHTNTVIDGIGSTSNLVVGMKLSGAGLAVGTVIVSITSATAIVVSPATTASATVAITTVAPLNPNPAPGYAWIKLKDNYARYIGGFNGFVSPTTGGTIAINGAALTVGNPYIIASVGHGAAGSATIAPVADVAGSLASTWFSLYDNYGNKFVIWFSVSGVGAAPSGVSGTLVQQSILANATAAQIGAALVLTIQNLPSGVAGVFSFTAAGTTTVTVTSTQFLPLSGPPADGLIPTGFAFALVNSNTNLFNWQAVGVPAGVIPNIGVSFIAKATGSSVGGGSTGLVVIPGISGVSSIEVIGDPNQSIAPIPMGGSPNMGAWILVQFLSATSAGVTTVIPTAPLINSVVGMTFYLEYSSVTISGE